MPVSSNVPTTVTIVHLPLLSSKIDTPLPTYKLANKNNGRLLLLKQVGSAIAKETIQTTLKQKIAHIAKTVSC